MSSGDDVFLSSSTVSPTLPRPEDPYKAFLRQKFHARCLERAAKAREEQVRRRRYSSQHPPSEASSDGFDDAMDEDDEDEDDETVMQDELFRRMMVNANRKMKHAYRVSYVLEVGSSFDPELEDVGRWEAELKGGEPTCSEEAVPPPDLIDEEIAAYAEELSALADFDDIPEDELFTWSDFEDDDAAPSVPLSSSSAQTVVQPSSPHIEDVSMGS
ncbi:hypothetical protein AMATHDRAFT_63366 [Amanita thiersii Skay4041]|uniref:Uncharacterized protein n=1 Tax=Amanita thiersii Skay4041 TaxID=703135 RepID=A0A2A9NH47_9AGAR|nr:hypothetical protein AMATHDRAFT_63366 [Amanita thiersii Skay4041]